MKKQCPHCGKNFTCENECVPSIFTIKLRELNCFCPSCAEEEKGYPKNLMAICPRFKNKNKEKVEFT